MQVDAHRYDMNLTPRWVQFLAEAGYDAVHWSVVGNICAKDFEICQYARERGLVVLTNDLDFPRIFAHTRDRAPSILLIRGEPLVPEIRGASLLRALVVCKTEIEKGAIVSLDCFDRPRAIVLPLS